MLNFVWTVERHGQEPLVSAGRGEGEDAEELQCNDDVRLRYGRAFNVAQTFRKQQQDETCSVFTF